MDNGLKFAETIPSVPVSGGKSGRDSRGKFLAGNRFSRGATPLQAKQQKLRAALLSAVTPQDLREVIQALLAKARGGDVGAAQELLNRVIGRPTSAETNQKLAELERALADIQQQLATERKPHVFAN